jgi:hypothetical protein
VGLGDQGREWRFCSPIPDARGEIDKAEFEEKRQTIAGLSEDKAQTTGNKRSCR